MWALKENGASASREIAAVAARCDKFRFQTSGIECRRAIYRAASSTGRHYHDDTNLVFTISGSLTQSMSSRTTLLTPSALMYVPAGEMHATNFGPGGASCFFVAMNAEWVDKRFDNAKIDGSEPRIIGGASYLQSVVLKMYEEFRQPDELSDVIMEGALLELFGRWFREGKLTSREIPGWLRTVRNLLHDSFRESISLEDLSQTVGVHSSHIAREFHGAYGLTVGEYIRKLRVDFVSAQLRNPNRKQIPLTDLALQAGFSSHAHMSSVFKRVTGMTPSQYQKAHGAISIW